MAVDDQKTPDGKSAEAFKHKKKGYKLFKAGYPRQCRVKPNVKKGGEIVYFLVRCYVNAKRKKKQYTVYVHLIQATGMLIMQNANALLLLVADASMLLLLCFNFLTSLNLAYQIYLMKNMHRGNTEMAHPQKR